MLVDPDSSQASCAHTQSGGMEWGGSSFWVMRMNILSKVGQSPSFCEGRPPTSSLGEKAVTGPNNVIVLLSHMQTTCLDVSFASVLATSATANDLEFMDKNI